MKAEGEEDLHSKVERGTKFRQKSKKIAAASFSIPSITPRLLITPSVCTVGTRLPLIARLLVLFPKCEGHAAGERWVVHMCRCLTQTPSRSFVEHTKQGHTVSGCEIMQRDRFRRSER